MELQAGGGNNPLSFSFPSVRTVSRFKYVIVLALSI